MSNQKIQLKKSHKTYSQYVSSGVEWIGDVPKGWEVKKLKRFSRILNGATPKSDNLDFWDGDIKWVTPDDLSKLKNEELYETRRMITKEGYYSCGTQVVPKNNLILSTRAPIGLCTINRVDVCANQGCRGIVLKNNNDERYYYYVLISFNDILNSFGSGSTFRELSRQKLGDFIFPAPPNSEQKKIADYLDKKIGNIEKIVAKKKEQVGLLKEKRASVISRAVTRGLNPSAELVDSGVEWIGKVPKGWEGKRLKTQARIVAGQSPDGASVSFDEVGLPFYQGKADFGKIYPRIRYYCSEPKKVAEKNDILISVRAPVGDLNLADQRCGIGRGLAAVRSDNWPYLFYILQATHDTLNSFSTGSTFDAITSGDLGNLLIPIPPKLEQQKIANYLDEQNKKIDAIIQKIEQSIQLLQEYKTSLISSVVRGRIKIS